jgi:hypothetical protein
MASKKQLKQKIEALGGTFRSSWTVGASALYATRLIRQARADVEMALGHHETYSHAYFFTPASNASSRRRSEIRNSFLIAIRFEGHLYEYESVVSESCKNVYYTGRFFVDGKKKNVRAFRKLEHVLGSI